MENEIRVCDEPVEIETRQDGGMTVRGYAVVFNSPSVDMGDWREIIRPGAFGDVLRKNPDVRALADHDSSKVLGRTKSGTLRLVQDARGLSFELDMPQTSYARDLAESIQRRDVTGASFAFRLDRGDDRWNQQDDGTRLREITRFAELREISIVTFPAYPSTEVAMRSLSNWQAEREEAEKAAARAFAGDADMQLLRIELDDLSGV